MEQRRMTAPTDSLASIAAKLRQISANPTCSAMLLHSDLCDLADTIERLDAKMRTTCDGFHDDYLRVYREGLELRARLAAFTDPLNGFTLADAALRTIVYDMGAFGTMLSNLSETDRLELRAGIAQAIERAALATLASVPKDAATVDEGKK
jgi:hypothetical protein